MKELRHSKQRDAIMEYLCSTHSHPTAETIHKNIRSKIPDISMGTVYRNLSLLEELGQIRKISCESTADHYDADTSDHGHLLCKNCGCIVDVNINKDKVGNIISGDFDGQITGFNILFSGLCPKCAGRQIN